MLVGWRCSKYITSGTKSGVDYEGRQPLGSWGSQRDEVGHFGVRPHQALPISLAGSEVYLGVPRGGLVWC